MPSNRVVVSRALEAERVSLWSDLDAALVEGRLETGARVRDLVRRIRAAGEALGYPTDPELVPIRCWRWYQMVETVTMLGLVARHVDWESSEVQQHGFPRGVRDFYANRAVLPIANDDPDDYPRSEDDG